ncbi:lipopolysaccharide biosynthesis protein [Klebsiella huaxiensis]|uniref:oligosaccharide flippase family protein n=1 Tax=Klebsiella huaxiensis TaxID=2153354 RepID=UPI000DD3460F|nr:oligosaccharide flippase family protein [Klebsiella huaxiensis]QBG07468.1 lipopolysaccharide biosynthesis protein [Klebsiella huaxiensis]VUS54884.1 Teichuronic acid biosynthesis protein TuaB [Klebsiella huaxiensis]
MSNLRSQAAWLLASNFFTAVLQIVQISILARNLDLRELGVLAIVNTVLMIAMILQDMGMSSYIVHKQELLKRDQSTIFWINLLLSLIAGIIVCLLSWPVSKFYHLNELNLLIMLASLNFIFLGALSQYQSHYIKSKKMILLAKIEMIAKFISFCFVVYTIYFTELRTSAVILGLILNAVLRLFMMAFFGDKRWNPSLEFNSSICKDIFKYGIFQLGSQVLNQLRTQLDVIIIGKVLGGEALGLYSLAKDLVMQPLKLISPVINRLALPRFAEVQSKTKDLGNVFLRGTSVIIIFSMITFLGIAVFSPVIVAILYGINRIEIVNILPYMLVFALLRPMGGLTGAIAQANGRTNVEFRWNVVATIVVTLTTSTIYFCPQLWYVSLNLSISQILISFLVYPFFIERVIKVSFLTYIYKWFPLTMLFIFAMFCIYNFRLLIHPFW